MNCPKCNSTEKVKNGIVRGLQSTNTRIVSLILQSSRRSNEYPKSMRKKAFLLCLEGLGFRSIGRILKVSNLTVLNWIRSFGKQVQSLRSESKEIEMVELDGMHSYIGNKELLPDMDFS